MHKAHEAAPKQQNTFLSFKFQRVRCQKRQSTCLMVALDPWEEPGSRGWDSSAIITDKDKISMQQQCTVL